MSIHQSSHRKKVLFLITKSNWGGAQRYVYDLATSLDRQQFEPVVALGGNGPLADMLHHASIRVIPLTHLKNSIHPRDTWAAFSEIRAILKTEKPTVFHLNSSVAGLIGALAGRSCLVRRIIFTAHGWAFNEDRPWWQKLILKKLHYCTVLLAHHTIAVSTAMVAQMNWPLAQRHMSVINPGRTIGPMYDSQQARAELVNFFPQLRPVMTTIWVGCIAELHPIKRHHILIESFMTLARTHPDVQLICIGDGILKDELVARVKSVDLDSRVFFVGAVHEAARFLPAFDYFVLASKSESYGYVIHEAGLARVPVIATNVGGITDIVTPDYSGLLVPANDSAALTVAFNTYLKNPNIAQRYAERLYATTSLNPTERMVKKTEYLYRL